MVATSIGGASALAAPGPPEITNASVSPTRFVVGRGTSFRYEVSKQADVFFFVDRRTRGRLVNGHCRRETSRNRSLKACSRYVPSGSFKQAAVAGANVKSFSGRIGSVTLRAALYRVKLVAVDAMGTPSTARVVLHFRVLRG